MIRVKSFVPFRNRSPHRSSRPSSPCLLHNSLTYLSCVTVQKSFGRGEGVRTVIDGGIISDIIIVCIKHNPRRNYVHT